MGLTWNNTNLLSLGVLSQLKSIPLIPEPKIITEDIATIDGVYDFSTFNSEGRVRYKQRRFEYECAFQEWTKNNVAAKRKALAAIFMQRDGYLEDDNFPGERFKGYITNSIQLTEPAKYLNKFNVIIETDPFPEQVEGEQA